MRYLPLLFVVSLFLTSCSKSFTPYTQTLVSQNAWTDSEVQRIQFYNSENIILRRQLANSESAIENGKIKMENGVRIEEIFIEKNTPGVAVFNPKGDRVAVSFESNRDDLYLMWGPNPKFRGEYMLLFKDRNKRRTLVTYDNREYRLVSSPAVRLLVDLDRNNNVDKNSRKAGGRKID